jgi:hypothetical protein
MKILPSVSWSTLPRRSARLSVTAASSRTMFTVNRFPTFLLDRKKKAKRVTQRQRYNRAPNVFLWQPPSCSTICTSPAVQH